MELNLYFFNSHYLSEMNDSENHFINRSSDNFQDYKDCTDAEGLTSLPTSDFRRPMTLEMRNVTNGGAINQLYHQSSPSNGLSTITLPLETPLRSHNVSSAPNPNNSYNGDLASLNSSDTYASCQTHPFLSQGDLTADMVDASSALDDLDMNNLYINPLEKDSDDLRTQVKKSASGDMALCNLGGASLDEGESFETRDRGSRVSLNETPVPKHRKTRFQQSSITKPKARFEMSKSSQESLNEGKKNRRSSFMPAKSLASATKLINQHLFGIQSISAKGRRVHFCLLRCRVQFLIRNEK